LNKKINKSFMKNVIILFTSSIFFIFFWGCIFKLEDEKYNEGESYLTISSDFTDVAGEQVINLSYSSRSTTRSENVTKVNATEVFISDDQNSKINFTSSAPGRYISLTSGIPGREYTLHFTLSNGKKYHSLAEKMPISPEITNLYYKFEIDNSQADYIKKYGYNVYIDFKDAPDIGDFYQWNWIHYEFANVCALCSQNNSFENSKQSCIKAVITPNNDNANKDGANYFKCNGNCWDISRSDGFNLLSDNYYNGQFIRSVKVHRADFKSLPSEYYLQIQQRKITKSTYLYLKSLENQLKSNGTLFDVPAQTHFNFNVFSDNEPDEKILGIFNVYSYKMKNISIPINQIINGNLPTAGSPKLIPYQEGFPPNIVYSDCLNGYNRTSIQPEGWKY